MSTEVSRRNELAQFVANHILGHVYRNVLLAVIHSDRVTDEGRENGRAAGPRLDDALVALLIHFIDLVKQVLICERSLLQRTCQYGLPPICS